jgi:WD40 repeat protein
VFNILDRELKDYHTIKIQNA